MPQPAELHVVPEPVPEKEQARERKPAHVMMARVTQEEPMEVSVLVFESASAVVARPMPVEILNPQLCLSIVAALLFPVCGTKTASQFRERGLIE